MIVETPGGQTVLLDGGEELHLTRDVQRAFGHLLADGPLRCAAIVVTPGDADRFAGLTQLVNNSRLGGQPMITADRVFHNGLVKRSTSRQVESFGQTVRQAGETYIVELHDDLTACRAPR